MEAEVRPLTFAQKLVVIRSLFEKHGPRFREAMEHQVAQCGGDSVQRAERGDSVRRLQRGGVPLLRCLLTMAHHNTHNATHQDSDLPWLHFPWLYTH